MKERICESCGTTILKKDGETRVITKMATPFCTTCQKILLGEDRPEYWTRVVD